jgi:hypothetical protein
MSINQGAVDFAQKAEDLALLATIQIDCTPEKFSQDISRFFEKAHQGQIRAFLLEFFIAYLSEHPAPSGSFSLNFQRAFEHACKPLIDDAKTWLKQAPADSTGAIVVGPQLQAYEEMLRSKECKHEKKIKRKQATKRVQAWVAISLAALPVIIAGGNYFRSWWSESNYVAIIFYYLFVIIGVGAYRNIVFRETKRRNLCAAWLTAILMALITFNSRTGVPEILIVVLVISAVTLPYIPYARGALGSVAVGIIATPIIYYLAWICSFVVITWVLREGSISKPAIQNPLSVHSGISAIGSIFMPFETHKCVLGDSYIARVSFSDLRNSKGVYLPHVVGVKAKDILLQERFNYHDRVSRDNEDTSDSIFKPNQRAHLRKVFESRRVRVEGGGDAMALLETNPILSVIVTDEEIVIRPTR